MAGNGEKAIAVTVERRQKLKPETAIILYREKEDFYRSGNTQEVILFEITERGEFVKPKALDMRCMQDIFNSANGKAEMEFLDSRILAHNNTGVVWYEPSRRTEIFFDCTEESRKDLNVLCKGKKVWWPALIFKLMRDGSLFCRALASSTRPNPQTKLYVAPLTHISAVNGHVCLPKHLHFDPNISIIENMKHYSEDFYRGIFGHETSGDLTTHPGGHDGLWREILKSPQAKRFPNQYLKDADETLQTFLK